MKTYQTTRSNRVLSLVSLLLIIVFTYGCIEEIDLFEGEQTPLIVSGEVTDVQGVHSVRLLFLEGYNVAPDYTKVRDAQVKIVDNLGQEEVLRYTGYGFFETTPDFKGHIGRLYHLEIVMSDGRRYSSIPEELLAVPQITGVEYTTDGSQLTFTADYSDIAGVENYYRWRFEGTFEVFAPYADPDQIDIPRNSQCYPSSFNVPRVTNCWVTDTDNGFLKIESDELYDGEERRDVAIYQLEVDRRFDLGYSGAIKQYSLTPRAFDFWSKIQDQLGNTGSIFETANYQIIGNIRSESDPEEVVLGYFSASAVSSSHVFVDQFQGTFPPEDCEANDAGCRPARCVSCLYYDFSSTKEKPEFWPY